MGTYPKKPFDKMQAHHNALELLFKVDRSRHAHFRENDFLEVALEYANERDMQFLQLLYMKLSSPLLFNQDVRAARVDFPGFTDVPLKVQRWLSDKLERIERGTSAELLSVARELDNDENARQIALFPKTVAAPSPSGYTLTRQMTWEAETPIPVLAHGLFHLLDTRWDLHKRLCRCKLASCGRWFLSRKSETDFRSGALRTAYCCREHALEADGEFRRIRARERRAREKAQRASKKPARKPK